MGPDSLCTDLRVSLPEWIVGLAAIGPKVTQEERMRVAIGLAARNVAEGTGGPFGAAVFERATGRLVSVGVNRVVPLGNSALHAEVVALMMAEAALGGFSLDQPGLPECELHTSCEPCAMCLGAIWWSGIRQVYCGAARQDAAAIGFDEGPVFEASYEYLSNRGLAIEHGLLRGEAQEPLRLYAERNGPVYNG